MASRGKRGNAGERVLEGRHVIGLFMLILLFSGLFFTLGYVMGRDGQVRAATDVRGLPDSTVLPKPEVAPKPSSKKSTPSPSQARRRPRIRIGSFTTLAIRTRPMIV